MIKPIMSEKIVRMMETENVLFFETGRREKKADIKKEIEDRFNIKIDKVRALIRNNKKYAYVKLNKKFKAIDISTKMGGI